jgi:hypothetical protein
MEAITVTSTDGLVVNSPGGEKARRVSALSDLLTEILEVRTRWWSKTLKRVESWYHWYPGHGSGGESQFVHGCP